MLTSNSSILFVHLQKASGMSMSEIFFVKISYMSLVINTLSPKLKENILQNMFYKLPDAPSAIKKLSQTKKFPVNINYFQDKQLPL